MRTANSMKAFRLIELIEEVRGEYGEVSIIPYDLGLEFENSHGKQVGYICFDDGVFTRTLI